MAVSQALALGFTILSGMAAAKRGPHWQLSEDDAGRLGTAWGTAIAPYLGAMTKHVPWATALVITAGMVTPRLQEDARLEQSRREANRNPPVLVIDQEDGPAEPAPRRKGKGHADAN